MSRGDYASQVGVPLAHYRDYHRCCIGVHCRECQHSTYHLAADVIERLQARGIDGELIGVVDLRRFIRQPCKRCGGRAFETRPHMDMLEPNVTAFWDRRGDPDV